jgi:hypothetical protein
MISKMGFFAREENDIRWGRYLSVDEKNLPQENEIWKFKLVAQDHPSFHYIKIICVAHDPDVSNKIVVFNQCDEKGLFKSLRIGEGANEQIVKQPFFLDDYNFVTSYCRVNEN